MRFLFVNDENEIFVHNGAKFEIKTISEANLVDNIDLIVAINFKGKLLEFYHAHSEAVMEFKYQNKVELEYFYMTLQNLRLNQSSLKWLS
jgi:hypothetical protein